MNWSDMNRRAAALLLTTFVVSSCSSPSGQKSVAEEQEEAVQRVLEKRREKALSPLPDVFDTAFEKNRFGIWSVNVATDNALRKLCENETVEKVEMNGGDFDSRSFLPLAKEPITYMTLDAITFDKNVVDTIASLHRLTSLDIKNPQPSADKTLAMLHGPPSLKFLKLKRMKVSVRGMEAVVSTYPNLEKLRFDTCPDFDCAGPLKKLDKLSDLWIGNSNFAEGATEELAKLDSLDQLSIEVMNLSDADMAPLSKLRRLSRLDLSRNPITDNGLANLSTMPALKDLNLTGCNQITKEGIKAFKKRNPNCTVRATQG